MKYPVILSVWIIFLDYTGTVSSDMDVCQDERSSFCRRIGQKQSLSRCYTREDRCCATCRRLRLNIPGCPYGDRASWCSAIGHERPISDCYTHNVTCCHTCSLFHTGIPDCPYGDQLNWCSEIGSRYLISSCYEKERSCCDTCGRFKQGIPGCEYGDHENWCPWISRSFCDIELHVCCATCALMAATTTTTFTTTTTKKAPPVASSQTVHSLHDATVTPEPEVPKSRQNLSEVITYTGSPGRPTEAVRITTQSPPVTGKGLTVIYTTGHSTKPPNSSTDSAPLNNNTEPKDVHLYPNDLRNGTESAESAPSTDSIASLDVLCLSNDTLHRLRHDKHGKKHRSRGESPLGIVCRNIPSAGDNYSKDSKDLDLSVNRTDGVESVRTLLVNYVTGVTPTSLRTGYYGEKEHQEGHELVFSLSPTSHSVTKLNQTLGILLLMFLVW